MAKKAIWDYLSLIGCSHNSGTVELSRSASLIWFKQDSHSILNIYFTSAKMCDGCLLAARNVVACNCADCGAALQNIELAGQTSNEMRFRPGEEREKVLSSKTPLGSWKKLFAQTNHCFWSQLFVVLFRLAHLVQLKEHQTSIDSLRFKF